MRRPPRLLVVLPLIVALLVGAGSSWIAAQDIARPTPTPAAEIVVIDAAAAQVADPADIQVVAEPTRERRRDRDRADQEERRDQQEPRDQTDEPREIEPTPDVGGVQIDPDDILIIDEPPVDETDGRFDPGGGRDSAGPTPQTGRPDRVPRDDEDDVGPETDDLILVPTVPSTGQVTPEPGEPSGGSGGSGGSAGGQGRNLDGSGIAYQVLPGATLGGGRQRLQPYRFTFEQFAGVPETRYPEAMIVKVLSGSFLFRAGQEDIVVIDSQGRPIPIVDPLANPPYYQQTGAVLLNETGQPCLELCAVPPDTTVLVEVGQTVHLPGDVTCFWCNVGGLQAELQVFAVLPENASPTDFSWTRLRGIGTAWLPAAPGAIRASISLPSFGFGCRAKVG